MEFEVFRSAGAPLVRAIEPRTRSVSCLGCGKVIDPVREWQMYCSDACRAESWRRRRLTEVHEQARLDFTPAPATGEPYESARLWLLARLKQGPVCTLELRREPWPASLNPAQRVLELRNRQYQIKTERREGKTYYRLEEGA